MWSLKIQKTVLNICNRAQSHCSWAKEEGSSSGNALAAWTMVCKPKKHGELGVLTLELQNKSLLFFETTTLYNLDNNIIESTPDAIQDRVPDQIRYKLLRQAGKNMYQNIIAMINMTKRKRGEA
jgi:hypothetical protein